MKYLYAILRLFKCPHKYSKRLNTGQIRDGSKILGNYYDKECSRCGKVKTFNAI